MKRSVWMIVAATLLLATTGALKAAMFTVTYDFTNGSPAATVSGDGAAMVTAANATKAANHTTYTFTDTVALFNATMGAATVRTDQTFNSTNIEPDYRYWEFQIAAATANPLDFLTVSYRVTIAGTTTTQRNAIGVLRTDAQDSGAFSIDVGSVSKGTKNTAFDAVVLSDLAKWQSGTLPLSGVTGVDATGRTSIKFRIYSTDDTSSTSQYTLLDDVVITGNVVPEPATLALVGLGGLAMLRRRSTALAADRRA